jgi:hypothetical protein
MANGRGKGKAKDTEATTKSAAGRRTRKRPVPEEEEVISSRPTKKYALGNLTEAERQAIFKEMTQQANAQKKARQEKEIQGVFLSNFPLLISTPYLNCSHRHTFS